jgi:hypothetical protein
VRRVRIRLDYLVQLSDTFDTSQLDPLTLAADGIGHYLKNAEKATIEPGTKLSLTFHFQPRPVQKVKPPVKPVGKRKKR